MINLAPSLDDSIYKQKCHDRIDFMIPWTNNIPDMIVWQNALWEQRASKPCDYNGATDFWQGWNEIPVHNSIDYWAYDNSGNYLLNIFFPYWDGSNVPIEQYIVSWSKFNDFYIRTNNEIWPNLQNQLNNYVQEIKRKNTNAKTVNIIFSCEMTPDQGSSWKKYFFTFDKQALPTINTGSGSASYPFNRGPTGVYTYTYH